MNFTDENELTINKTLEHSRACSTDDLECFFSLMRDVIGQNFTTKEVKFGMRKIILKFVIQIYHFITIHLLIHVFIKDVIQSLTRNQIKN